MNDIESAAQERQGRSLLQILPAPPEQAVKASHRRLSGWFTETAETIFWTQLDTAIGILFLAANQNGLTRVSFAESPKAFIKEIKPTTRLLEDDKRIGPYRQQLEEYFSGQRLAFSLLTDLSDRTEFQRQVLRAIEAIPAGQVRSYGQIAAAIDRPGSARAVGQALGSNPIPIVLPCHRVVASDGGLGGYRGGLERKRRLLALEGAIPAG